MKLKQKVNDFNQKVKLTQSQILDVTQTTLTNIKKNINKKTVEEFAKESKLIKRISSKIIGFDFLAAMLVSSLNAEYSTLERISDIINSINHKVRIKPQSIMEKLNSEAAPLFFKMVLEKILKNQLDSLVSGVSPDILEKFTKILVQDSSSIDLHEKLSDFFKGSGGRASKASAKIDVIYDFKTKRYEYIKITDHQDADQKLSLNILNYTTPNTLIIRDLGYLRMDCINKIAEIRAFFLSRFKNNICVFLKKDDTEQLDLAEYLYRNYRNAFVIDLEIFITESKVPVRLIAYQVPDEISAIRKRKAHATAKKQGRTLSKKKLNLLDYSIFITNVPKEVWKAEVIGTIYRFRWQIELLYKSWKSGLKIDHLKGINQNRIRALIYARIILIIIINEIYKMLDYFGYCINEVVSMHKVFNWMRNENRLLRILKGKLGWWEERYIKDLIKGCMSKQKRKKRKTTLQSISECEFYYQEAS